MKVVIDKIIKSYNTSNQTHKINKEELIIFKFRFIKAIETLYNLQLYKK